MTPQEFIAKWKRSQLSERSAAQSHFLDLCRLLGHPEPAQADPEGTEFTFERGVHKTDGEQGWADVWKRGHFGWEYKGKHKDLKAAYRQLQLYREDLENPPLLVVCDMDRFEVHTNFTGTQKVVHAFDLDGLADPHNLDVLRKVFFDPEALRPDKTTARITEEAAAQFTQLADGLRIRGIDPQRAAHFLMKLIFCLFAEDIGLLPTNLFTTLLDRSRDDPPRLAKMMQALFAAMSKGGDFGVEPIAWFNGGLFAEDDCIELRREEIGRLILVSRYGWESVEPSIFGTLFERLLDPSKRSQIGAHYTSRQDILTLVEPVVMTPLRREWQDVQLQCEKLWPKIQAAARKQSGGKRRGRKPRESKARRDFDGLIRDFDHRLSGIRILDPACGSGNFLYVAINLLLDLEKEVIAYASQYDVTLFPHVRPTQLHGIEINPYAQELASVVIWIGYLQWMHHNGFAPPADPVLEPIETIRLMDAILDLSDPEHPQEPAWPAADFIIGNPPFLGGKLLRTHLGDDYVDKLFQLWRDRVRPEADVCCYWFEKARAQIETGKCQRAGLLATQGIRGGANRETLKRIKEAGDIFFAESDRDWILDGAHVHISMVGFDDGAQSDRILDGKPVEQVNSNLTGSVDISQAGRLHVNLGMSFMGDTKGGSFDINEAKAVELLDSPNPHGVPNSNVLIPWINGMDVTRRPRDMWIIDFGVDCPQEDAAQFELPFEYVREQVYPARQKNKRAAYKEEWWLHVEPRSGMRKALEPLPRFLVTTTVSKHRLFVWAEAPTLPDHQLIVFARSDDYFFGVLQSRIHEVWALRLGTRLETRPRYTPTTCFETFPFPEPTDEHRAAIAEAARELDALRKRWLNPPEWTREEVLEFPGSADGPWSRYIDQGTVTASGGVHPRRPSAGINPAARSLIGTVRYPRLVPKDEECAKELKKRTLTNLYNTRPTWLALAHQKLDTAVATAYGWDAELPEDGLLAKLLELDLTRAATDA